MWIIDQHRSEVIACTAVNPGSWIGCGSPRLDFDWRRLGGLLHDGSKGKETQTHVREFSGLCILDWLKQLLRSSNPCASTNTSGWLQCTFQKPVSVSVLLQLLSSGFLRAYTLPHAAWSTWICSQITNLQYFWALIPAHFLCFHLKLFALFWPSGGRGCLGVQMWIKLLGL